MTDTSPGRDLLRHHGDDFAFLISFAVIGSCWFVHHGVFRHLARLGG